MEDENLGLPWVLPPQAPLYIFISLANLEIPSDAQMNVSTHVTTRAGARRIFESRVRFLRLVFLLQRSLETLPDSEDDDALEFELNPYIDEYFLYLIRFKMVATKEQNLEMTGVWKALLILIIGWCISLELSGVTTANARTTKKQLERYAEVLFGINLRRTLHRKHSPATCPVCYSTITESPDLCPNGHTICATCVNHILLTPQSIPEMYRCPMCRAEYGNLS